MSGRWPRVGTTPAEHRVTVRLTARELLDVDALADALSAGENPLPRGEVLRFGVQELARTLLKGRRKTSDEK